MSDGTFRPSGVTAWSSYNTPRIWAMVEREDDPESWRQVAALGSMAGLLKDQRSRLEAAKQKLIDAWPPERNKAARAFVDEMDGLLFTMQANKDIADSNAGALGQILEALRQAKEKIAPLYQSYLDKSDDWVPGWWDHAEEELDEQARQHMREAEEWVAHPGNAITAPAIYEFQPDETRTRPDDESGGDRPAVGAGAADSIAVPHDPPPPVPGQESAGPTAPGTTLPAGPSLAEAITPAPANPAPSVVAPATAAAGGSQLPGLVIGGGASQGLTGTPLGGGGAGRGLTGTPLGGGGAGRGPTGTPLGGAAQRGLPPGAVIGNGVPGRGPTGPAGPVKPTPPSWLPPASGQAPRAGTGAAGSSALPMSGSHHPDADDRDTEITLDVDSRWVTSQGVAPVIEPSRKTYRHDPGPGVIGWHG
ncbi:hypothetical protein ACQP2Y_06290 [Actinoplanes sp. CA-051413]|uniref:hypothetical protein n=1 Tax=Actinoplanes sp. CA-051413 TaxID=3239899 RepID=UPI003D96338C